MEFLNIALAGTAESLSLTLDWYQIFWANEGESFDETDMEDSVFSGKWESGGLWASGAGTIRLTQFYEQSGKQYAVGTMDTPDGHRRLWRWHGHKEVRTWKNIVRIAAMNFIPALASAPNAVRRCLTRPRIMFPLHSRNLCRSHDQQPRHSLKNAPRTLRFQKEKALQHR